MNWFSSDLNGLFPEEWDVLPYSVTGVEPDEELMCIGIPSVSLLSNVFRRLNFFQLDAPVTKSVLFLACYLKLGLEAKERFFFPLHVG